MILAMTRTERRKLYSIALATLCLCWAWAGGPWRASAGAQDSGAQDSGAQDSGAQGVGDTAQEPPSDAELRSRVSELVDTLDAAQLAQRQQAERDLIGLGVDALSYLPEIDGRFSAEAQQRLRRVRRALEQAKAESEAEAKTVRLGTVTTLDQALTKITDATGVPFQVAGEVDRPLEMTLGPVPFWAALDAVLDATDLDVNFYVGAPGELGIGPRAPGRPSRTDSAAYAGVYRLETTAVTARRDFRSPAVNRLTLEMEIAWEPRLTPVGLTLPLDSVVAVLDGGQRLTPDAGQLDVAANSTIPFVHLNVPLPLPEGSPRKIATLTGTLRSMLPGAREHFTVDLGQPHDPETVGNVTLFVEDVRANGTLHEVRVEVVFQDAANAFESHRQWVFENPAYVTIDDGTRLEHLGYQIYRQASDRVGIGYMFDLNGEPEGKTFHYETPVSIIHNEVDFVMKDILLP